MDCRHALRSVARICIVLTLTVTGAIMSYIHDRCTAELSAPVTIERADKPAGAGFQGPKAA